MVSQAAGGQELHQLWAVLHKRVVEALRAEGICPFLAVATVLGFARHRHPLPWHALAEYGLFEKDRAKAKRALANAGLGVTTKRGIMKTWLLDGEEIRTMYGCRALGTVRAQRWPWADVFVYEDEADRAGYNQIVAPAYERNSGAAKINFSKYHEGFFAGRRLLVPSREEAGDGGVGMRLKNTRSDCI